MSKKLNVLMIEDSENDALLLVQALKKNGYLISFLRVETAEEMTEALNQPAWDLIISDYNLPRFNGLDALLLLKQKGLDIPFIVVSGSIGEELAVKLMKAGAQDYIMKDNLVRLVPAISRELQEVIERTKRREAEQQLRDSEERYRLLVEHAPDAIFIQCENKFIYVNTPFVKMIKASTAQAILGKNIWDFIHPDCLNIVKKYVEQLDMEVIMPSFEGKFICTDGSIIDVDISAGLCIYHGKYAAHVFIRDISERKKAQSIMQQHQLELDQISRINSMGEMASALAHELNQPLTSIGSFTSGCVRRLQSDVFEKDEIIKVMQIVSEQTKYAGEIIHRMKNFVRRGELSQETTTISEVITHALSLMAFQIQQFSVKICLDLSEGLPQVLLDKIQVEQVILNLSRNAIEAMQHKNIRNPTLFISTLLHDENNIVVKIVDNGPGFSKESDKHLFQPYYTTKPHGMGMGLSISRTIIEAHGGQLSAHSLENGSGACFQFTLPIVMENTDVQNRETCRLCD